MIIVNARFLTQNITGVQRFALEICVRLKKLKGGEIIFLSPKNILQKEYAKKLDVQVVGAHLGHVWEQWDLPRYLKKLGNPLLINLCNTAPLFYENKVVTVHDVAFEVYPKTFSKSFLYFYKFMIPKIINLSKHVITVSQFSKKEILKFYNAPDTKVSVVYNAVSSSFNPVYKASVMEKYFLAVSSLNARKNYIYILQAFEHFKSEGGEGKLYIIGDMSSSSFADVDMSNFVENTNIKFLGRVSDDELIKYFANAYAFLFPSLYEGFGIPPLEAQTCGCPVICAETSCLPEIFGNSVLYCNPNNIFSLVKKMHLLSKDIFLRKEIIEKGKINSQKYSWDNSAEELLSIITSL